MSKNLPACIVLTTFQWFEKCLEKGCKVFDFPPGRKPRGIKKLVSGSICLILAKPPARSSRSEWSFVGEFTVKNVKPVKGEEFSVYANKAVKTEIPFPKPGEFSWIIEFEHIIKYDRPVKLKECNDIKTLTSNKPLSERPIHGFTFIKPEDAHSVIEAIRKKAGYEGPLPSVINAYRLELFRKISNLSEFIVLLKLCSGKNVLLSGPPGSGKTRFLKELLKKLEINYILETGNPEWTPFDTLGGFGLGPNNNFKKGFIFDAIEKSYEAVKNGKLYWLVIDEINRANVDLAFGKFFTLLDPVYRCKESLRIYGINDKFKEVWIPLSFRVLATMNNYDRALLFKLGYALTRRFAIIDYSYLEDLQTYYEEYCKKSEQVLKKLLELSSVDYSDNLKIDYNAIKSELLLKNDEAGLKQDSIVPIDFSEYIRQLEGDWKDKIYSIDIPNIGNIKLNNVIVSLAWQINNLLLKFEEGEIYPIQITPGVIADALKYLAIGAYVYKRSDIKPSQVLKTNVGIEQIAYTLLLLDSAFSAYILPQLDILADYVRREELQYRFSETKESSLKSILGKISSELKDNGLIYSSKLVSKLSKGYHVF
jgi:predicted transcriptional regulator